MNKNKVSLTLFDGVNDKELYTKYLQLKYQVFVQELNFRMDYDLSKHVALPDPYDSNSKFAIAMNEKGNPMGILRGILSKDGFPKKELIKHHLKNINVHPLLRQTATLNALAVKQEYRSKRYKILNTGNPLSIATALSFLMFENLNKCGVRLVFLNATATVGATAYVYYKLGFKVIDPPYIYQPKHPAVVNMAILLPNLTSVAYQPLSEQKPLTSQEYACMEYLEAMQKKVLGHQSIWKLFKTTNKLK